MTFPKQVPLFLFFFFFFPLLNASDLKRCYSSSCGHGKIDEKINVRFPFWLFPKQPESCGHTGFNLLCTDYQETTLKLPNSETFLVREIDYQKQRIRLNDPENCLARRLLSFDASGSPFSPLIPLNYVFLISCPKKDVDFSYSVRIRCLSNATSSFFASRLDLEGLMPPSCQIFRKLLLPVSEPLAGFLVDLNNQDLWLKWDSPNCSVCERRTNSRCGFINNTTLQVQCFSSVNSGLHNTGLQVLKIICLSLVGPLTALTFCVGLVMCSSERVSSQIQQAVVARLSGSVTVTPQPSEEVITRTGLDESTIESYKKVELGESRRLPTGSNDVVCSICLSEYATKESVRCLPECEHCFHTECIDAWLKLHSSCPVCRSNPSPSRQGFRLTN